MKIINSNNNFDFYNFNNFLWIFNYILYYYLNDQLIIPDIIFFLFFQLIILFCILIKIFYLKNYYKKVKAIFKIC